MNDYEKLRSEAVQMLKKDFIGPYFGETEELILDFDETPLKRYLTGVLYPRSTLFNKEEDIEEQKGSDVSFEAAENSLALSNLRYPSSFGISFACPENVQELNLTVKAALYKRTVQDEEAESGKKSIKSIWKRIPLEWSQVININKSGQESILILEDRNDLSGEYRKSLELRIISRKPDVGRIKAITLAVINNFLDPKKAAERCEKSFFQVHISAKGNNNERPFVDRKPFNINSKDRELKAMQLLYAKTHSFSIGHGCSVEWSDEYQGKAGVIETSFVPQQKVYPLVSPEDLDLPKFSIKKIASSSIQELKTVFEAICKNYEKWIKAREGELSQLPREYQDIANEHIELCRKTSVRIKSGISILSSDTIVFQAFQLAHKAMLYQFAHSVLHKEGWPVGKSPNYDGDYYWYPYQIAFILQCLESITNPDSQYRKTVDLLWFPTGGGKTEAYLGLVAFVLFLRRLRGLQKGKTGSGTAVLTRYTLRLLTVDQFIRTTLLACSCEKVRKDIGGKLAQVEPVTIGLWVGAETSPNTLRDAKDAIDDINNGREPKSNPIQLIQCPWCGRSLNSADYNVNLTAGMRIKCPNSSCFFSSGFPVWIVDEDIYRNRPSIIIGTVDKFARLPWIKEAGYIFGSDRKSDPPELIIQDELHLISGPLGTLVGLYETAIDLLCRNADGHEVKIIASTATIRNASSQIRNLFNRNIWQFPQSALDYRDSFFAREDSEDKRKMGRLYVGVLAPGLSPTTSLIRTFSCLLHTPHASSTPENIKDPYWTLIGYFNSLRELGGAVRQVQDDVSAYLAFCATRDNLPDYRIVENLAELASRRNSKELNLIRSQLWDRLPADGVLDVVLATNMISVGLDVPRLGLMSVVGQPKTTSEYIQATSRIGRQYPGLVVTVYNWTRSRDRSHYERFKSYHIRLYSDLEATSVTPFSSRSRDRGLHAVIIMLARHLMPELAENEAAANFNPENPEFKRLIEFIQKRTEDIDDLEFDDTQKNIERIIEKWINLSKKSSGRLFYSSRDYPSLLISAEEEESEQSFSTLNSLRNVDPAAGLYLKKGDVNA